jgi:hypothetical protein
MATPGTDAWSFRCSACGKCCNSPPEMSVPELFHHQHRFVGCLAVRRLPRVSPGDRLAGEGAATAADARAYALLADALWHRLSSGAGDVLIATRTNRALRAALARAPARAAPGQERDVEAWMGLS